MWRVADSGFPEGPCLYALEAIELFSKSETLLWKLGRTKDLRKRIRGYPSPMSLRFFRLVGPMESIESLERDAVRDCPFPRGGSGREWFRASCEEMQNWLMGDAHGQD